jgi:dinuclear metal center YbgI/SA1388 family protein
MRRKRGFAILSAELTDQPLRGGIVEMTSVADVNDFISQLAPPELAEDWDNTGLLVGDPAASVRRIMTCLTITPESAGEAIERAADVIITHHPLPFRPLNRLTTSSTAGRLLIQLIRANIAIISPHTAFDSAASGINQMLAEKYGLQDVKPLVMASEMEPAIGAGRCGVMPGTITLTALLERSKSIFGIPLIRFVGAREKPVSRIALACGSGGSFLERAAEAGCDTMITGEASFHTCLEAKSVGMGLVLLGHHTSERFALETLAGRLQGRFAGVETWCSESEVDPVQHA